MSAQALINRYARAFIRAAMSRVHDYALIRLLVGMPLNVGPNDEYDFDPSMLAGLSRQIELLMRDEFCGLTTTPCRIGAFSLMFELMINNETLEEALSKAFLFYAVLTDDINFELNVLDDRATVNISLTRPEIDVDNFLCEWWFLNWRALASWLVGEEIPFIDVALTHNPAIVFEVMDRSSLKPVAFGQPNSHFSFERRHLIRRIVRNAADLRSFIANQSIDLITIPGVEQSFGRRVTASGSKLPMPASTRWLIGNQRALTMFERVGAGFSVMNRSDDIFRPAWRFVDIAVSSGRCDHQKRACE